VTLVKFIAPLMPFLAEEMYQNLVRSVDSSAPESVHLCPWPEADRSLIDAALEKETALVRDVISLGRSAREKANLKVRQPLAAMLCRVEPSEAEALGRHADSLREELNIKALEFIGPKDEFPEGLRVEAGVQHAVGLDARLTPELENEGFARELVHHVQNLRKEAGFEVADRIRLQYSAGPRLAEAIAAFADYIRRETLAVELGPEEIAEPDIRRKVKANGQPVELALKKER